MRIPAKADYALRALLILADADPALVKLQDVAARQQLPVKFAESILGELRRAELVRSRRGSDGGYGLGRPADRITLGAVLRVVDGSWTDVPGCAHPAGRPVPPVEGVAAHLPAVWAALAASVDRVLEGTTLAQILVGEVPRLPQDLKSTKLIK